MYIHGHAQSRMNSSWTWKVHDWQPVDIHNSRCTHSSRTFVGQIHSFSIFRTQNIQLAEINSGCKACGIQDTRSAFQSISWRHFRCAFRGYYLLQTKMSRGPRIEPAPNVKTILSQKDKNIVPWFPPKVLRSWNESCKEMLLITTVARRSSLISLEPLDR